MVRRSASNSRFEERELANKKEPAGAPQCGANEETLTLDSKNES